MIATGHFMPQVSVVATLLDKLSAFLLLVPDSAGKRQVIEAMAPFERVIVPSVLGLDEIVDQLFQKGVQVDDFAVADILLDAAYDLDMNYANDVIEYHLNEYVGTLP